jgi:O-antigen/teichoic acid export membrane protein
LQIWTPSIAVQATKVLQLLALAGYIGTLTASMPNNIMVALGKIRPFTIYATIRNLVLAISCFIFIRHLGIEGAGWALLITCTVDVFYLVIVLQRYLQIAPLQLFKNAYLRPMILGIGFAGLAYFIRPLAISWYGFGITIVILSSIYVSAGFAFGIFGETEKRAACSLIQLICKKKNM